MTKKELKEKIKALGNIDLETKKKIICDLIGHSKICTVFLGQRYCARCGKLLGDSWMSVDFGAQFAVVVGHNCDVCKENYKKCTWRDKLYCKDPFVCSDWDKKYEKLPYLMIL